MIVVWVAVVVLGGCLLGGLMVGTLMLFAQRSAETTAVMLAVEARKTVAGYDPAERTTVAVGSRRLRALPAGKNRVFDE